MVYARRNEGFGGGSRGGSKFGGASHGRGFSDRGGVKPMMYPATCAECSARCEVPFRPNGRKPVLCKNCFSKGNDFAPKFAPRQDGGRSVGGDDTAAQLRSINGKLDAILKVLNSDEFSL